MSWKWIEYKGKKILFGDYRGLKGEQMVANLIEIAGEIQKSPIPILVLENYTGCYADKAFTKKGQAAGKELQSKIKKMAQVGLLEGPTSGLKMIIIQAFIAFSKVNLKLFHDEQKALEYLVQN